MNMKIVAIVIGVLLIVGLFGVVAYFAIQEDQKDEGKLGIVVSLLPQKEFAERIGGEHVSVTVMVGEGQEPHGYEPSTAQMKDVAEADIYFKVGSGVEFETAWMDKFIEQNSKMKVVDGSAGINLIEISEEHDHEDDDHEEEDDHNETDDKHDEEEHHNETEEDDHEEDQEDDHHHHGDDPHIWTSPSNAKIMVQNLLTVMKAEDPGNADEYQKNADAYLAELDSLISEISTGLEPYADEKFLVYHPAFGYFAHEFDLVQLAVEDEGKEPTAKGLEHVIEQAKDESIKVVFVEPQFDKHNAQTIADEIGGSVITLDPLSPDYIQNLREISEKLIEAFEDA